MPKGFPFVDNIPAALQSTLDERRKFTDGVSKSNTYNPPDTIWIRMHSNAYPIDTQPSRKYINILTGGMIDEQGNLAGGFNEIYNYPRTTSNIYRPLPGIESVRISTKGDFGQTISTDVSWTCNSIDDLEELIPYFLTPGVTILLEWGRAKIGQYIDALPLDNANNLRGTLVDFYKNPQKLFDKMIESNGEYGILIGILSNFSFSPNDDGTFACTTEITSMGELITSLNLNESRNYISTTVNEEKRKIKTIKEYMNKDFDKKFKDGYHKRWVDSGDIIFNKGWFGGVNDMWVTWRFIEDEIINEHIKIYAGDSVSDGYRPLKINSEDVYISNDKYLFSSDPSIMLIGRRELSNSTDGPIRSFDVQGDINSGIMRNIYVHIDVVKDSFENSERLDEAIKKILVQINSAGLKIWNFKLQIDPITDTFRIIDLNYASPGLGLESVYNFGGFSRDSIMKSYEFNTTMNEAMKTHIMFARNRDLVTEKDTIINAKVDSGVDTLWNTSGFDDMVLSNLKNAGPLSDQSGDSGVDTAISQTKTDMKKERTEEDQRKQIEEGTQNFKGVRRGGFMIIDNNIKELVSEVIRRKTRDNIRRHQVLLPIELSVTVNGITGLLPGNVFRIRNIPNAYYENGVFQITNIEHAISPDDWSTSIKSIYRIVNLNKEIL